MTGIIGSLDINEFLKVFWNGSGLMSYCLYTLDSSYMWQIINNTYCLEFKEERILLMSKYSEQSEQFIFDYSWFFSYSTFKTVFEKTKMIC